MLPSITYYGGRAKFADQIAGMLAEHPYDSNHLRAVLISSR
ncbi:hypothetical protein [Nonomuraea terrae]|nr:hypothetical protein [Nonomuraea terrae]